MLSYTYAIGDIHGNVKVLQRALNVIAKHRGARHAHLVQKLGVTNPNFSLDDTIVFCGDYIDRGYDSPAVLDLLVDNSVGGQLQRSLKSEYGIVKVVTILGNHDAEFLNILRTISHYNGAANIPPSDIYYKASVQFFNQYGGKQTDTAYLISNSLVVDSKSDAPKSHQSGDSSYGVEFVVGTMYPKAHHRFLLRCETYYYDDYRIFVHGWLPSSNDMVFSVKKPTLTAENATLAMIEAAINPEDAMWHRFGPFDNYQFAGRHIVHGHTPVEQPDLRTNRTNIDTNAWKTGVMHIAVFDNEIPGGPLMVMDTKDFTHSWFERTLR